MTGAELKTLRTKLGLTQALLALKVGVTRNAVNQWEMGIRGISEPVARFIQVLAKESARNAKQKRKVKE